MRDSILVAFLVMVGCGGGAGGEDPDGSRSARCARMRDRIIELSLADTVGLDEAPHREAMRRALGPELVVACESSMTDEQVACVLGAEDPAGVLACGAKTDRYMR